MNPLFCPQCGSQGSLIEVGPNTNVFRCNAPPCTWVGKTEGIQKTFAISVGMTVDQVERLLIEATLEAAVGNKSVAATMLGISRRSLYNKLAVYLQQDKERKVRGRR